MFLETFKSYRMTKKPVGITYYVFQE